MVLGLSEDTIGKFASVFKEGSKMFLQYSFMLLGLFGVLFGLTIYGWRFLYLLGIILATLIVTLVTYLYRKSKSQRKKLRFDFNLSSLRKYRSVILGLIFLALITGILYYPNSWFYPQYVVFVFFIFAMMVVTLILAYHDGKQNY
jgi:MFS family permease